MGNAEQANPTSGCQCIWPGVVVKMKRMLKDTGKRMLKHMLPFIKMGVLLLALALVGMIT